MDTGFRKGDLVLAEKPFAYVLNDECRSIFCDFCFTKNVSLMKCSKCKIVMYCNKTCQKEAWKEHKQECHYIGRLKSSRYADTISGFNALLLTSRVLLKLQGPEVSQKIGGYLMTFDDMTSDMRGFMTQDMAVEFSTLRSTLKACMGNQFCYTPSRVSEILAKVTMNKSGIFDPESYCKIGVGLYIGSTMLKHSCQPDCDLGNRGTELIVRAVKDIPTKDMKKISIRNIDLKGPVELRQCYLTAYYYSTCKCVRCINPLLDELSSVIDISKLLDVKQSTKETSQTLEMMKTRAENPFGELQVIKKCLKNQEGVLKDTHLYRCHFLKKAQELCFELKMIDEAVKYALRYLEVEKYYKGEVCRDVVYSWYTIAKYYMDDGNITEGINAYWKAYEASSQFYGPEHEFTLKIKTLYNKFSSLESKKEDCQRRQGSGGKHKGRRN